MSVRLSARNPAARSVVVRPGRPGDTRLRVELVALLGGTVAAEEVAAAAERERQARQRLDVGIRIDVGVLDVAVVLLLVVDELLELEIRDQAIGAADGDVADAAHEVHPPRPEEMLRLAAIGVEVAPHVERGHGKSRLVVQRVVELLMDVRGEHDVVRSEGVSPAHAVGVGRQRLPLVRAEILGKEAQLEVALLTVAVPVLGLDARLRGELGLEERVDDVVALVVVRAEAVAREVIVADAERRPLVDAGDDAFAAVRVVRARHTGRLQGRAVPVEEQS